MKEDAIGSWADVETLLKSRPLGAVLRVPKSWLEHPRAHGMRLGVGIPAGQRVDYVKRLDESTRLEVEDYRQHYMARLNVVDSHRFSERHMSSTMSGVLVGAVLGGALGRTERALVAGAAVGGVLWSALRK